MMGANHIYSKFLIRNCWQGQKIFLESPMFLIEEQNESCRVWFFFCFVSKFSPPEAPARLLVWACVGFCHLCRFSKTQQGLTWQQRSSLVPCAAAGAPGPVPPCQGSGCQLLLLFSTRGAESSLQASPHTSRDCPHPGHSCCRGWWPKPMLTDLQRKRHRS